jgi:beta-glucosidase
MRLPAAASALLLLLSGLSAFCAEPVPLYRRVGASVDERVRDLLGRMTVEEKARQLDMYRGVSSSIGDDADAATRLLKTTGLRTEDAVRLWGRLGAGSIHDVYPDARLSNQIQSWVMENSRLGIPVLFIEEGLHGFSTGTIFPAPVNLAATWDPAIAEKTGAAIAAETRASGVDMLLAPVLDLAREPRWGRVEEDFGEDPYLSGRMGLAWVSGAQGQSLASDRTVIAEPKHFAGHGSPEGGLNAAPVHIGERELRSTMLKSFEPAIRLGHAGAVMAAYHEIDGIPCAANPLLLTTILRGEWGFRGFVLGDLGTVKRLVEAHHTAATAKDAIVMALNAGLDMQFYDYDHDVFEGAIVAGRKDGSLKAEALDRAVSAVLRAKFELGLFDRPLVDPGDEPRIRRAQAHLDLSLQSARESMTLLRNENGLLPLSRTVARIALIGPNANAVRLGDYTNPGAGQPRGIADSIRDLLPAARITVNDGADIPSAVRDARLAEVVIVGLGEWLGLSGEGFDRSSLDLPGNQQALLEAVMATGKPCVLVLQNGRPLSIPWAKQHVAAILEAWYSGEFGGRAIAETLFGENNPGGHLTITFPRGVGQLPDYYSYDSSKFETGSKYVDEDNEPLFPFGFGLSYSTFQCDRIRVIAPRAGTADDVVVSADFTNVGKVDGDEVAQLYLHQTSGSVETPVKALKGFSRVHLKAGERRTVTFRVPQSELAVWNSEHQWVVEPGPYEVMVGDSSEAAVSAAFTLQ